MSNQQLEEKGLVIVYTGNGKGKTTAALGLVIRAIGYGLNVGMIQFIKGEWHYGELNGAKRLEPEFDLILGGKGFVGILDDDHPFEDHVRAAETALELAKRKILSGNYRLFILDEINYAIKLGLISTESVLELIKIKPKQMTLVLTGNHADSQIISISDLVTEMKEIKHPFKAGIKAQRGIDL